MRIVLSKVPDGHPAPEQSAADDQKHADEDLRPGKFLPDDIPVRSASYLEAWRRLYARFPIGPPPDAAIARRFGKFAARTLPGDTDIFVGWSGASLEAVEAANRRGMVSVVERGSTHILHQKAVLERIYRENGLSFRGIPAEIVERELAEYEAADFVSVPTRFVASTFVDHGIPDSRLFVNPYGVDAARFACPARPARSKPTILFVGAVGFQKGAPDLLHAFARLGRDASLEFAGPLEAG